MNIKRVKELTLVLCWILTLFSFSCHIDLNDSVDNRDKIAEETFYYAFKVDSQTGFELDGVNGEIEIVGISDADSVVVAGTRRVGSESIADAEAHLEKLKVNTSQNNDKISVETKQPSDSDGRNYTVNYEIRLPKVVNVNVDNKSGIIKINNITGDVDVDNTNGNIFLDNILGNADIDLVNGNIDTEITLPENGNLDIDNVNGNISVKIPSSTSARLNMSVANGTLSTSNLVMQINSQSRTKLSAILGDGNGEIDVSNVNGNISLTGF